MKKVSFVLSAAVAAFMFAGCSAKGPSFKEFKQAEQGKALLYVYREGGFGGSAISYDIHVDSKDKNATIGTLRPKGYLEITLDANKNYEIWAKTEAKSSLNLQTKPNEVYCVKGSVGIGFFVGHPKLEFVNTATCKSEITQTNLSIGDEPKTK